MLMNSPTAKSLHVTNPECSIVLTKAVPFPTAQVSLCSLSPLPDILHCLWFSISFYLDTPAAPSTSQKANKLLWPWLLLLHNSAHMPAPKQTLSMASFKPFISRSEPVPTSANFYGRSMLKQLTPRFWKHRNSRWYSPIFLGWTFSFPKCTLWGNSKRHKKKTPQLSSAIQLFTHLRDTAFKQTAWRRGGIFGKIKLFYDTCVPK